MIVVLKIMSANVLDLVLENYVERIRTADMVYIVVLMENVPQIVWENFVHVISTAD